MTAKEKRAEVKRLFLSRKGKNSYTTGANRVYFWGKPAGKNPGYSDCSSATRAAFKKVLGIDIGSNTAAQVRSKRGVVVDKTDGLYPNEDNLKIGDCLYFKGNSAHPEGVGHVELYLGNGQCAGHGSGMGPKVHTLKSYCKSRGKAKRYYKAIRWIQDDQDAPGAEPDPTHGGLPDEGEHQAGRGQVRVTGGTVHIRSGPGTDNASLGIVKRGTTLNRTGQDQDGWVGVLYGGVQASISAKYVEEVK